MTIKKTYNILLFAVLTIISLVSCDKLDKNGKLDGNWQLTKWIDNNTGNIVATNQEQIFYCVKLELIQFNSYKIGQPYFAYFTYKDDYIQLGSIFKNTANSDIQTSINELTPFGVSNDGYFQILELTSKKMTLKNHDNTLFFRKY